VDVVLSEDGKRRLAVDTSTKQKYLSPKYRVDFNRTKRTFSGSSYVLLYEYTGTGILHGFHIDTNSDKTQVRLLVDSEEIMSDIQIKDVSDLSFKTTGTPSILLQNRSGLATEGGSDLDFSPHESIHFSNHVRIYVKKSDATTVDVNRSIVYISKL
jgi:hypothetical protein